MSATVTRQLPLVAADDLWDLVGTGDPSVAPGLDYAVGSRFTQTDGALGTILWVKYGAGATQWSNTLGGSGGGGGSGVSSITATTPLTASAPTGAVSLTHDASGVSAGTYGDATHVAQVTVDAEGHVTAASNVALSLAASSSFVPTYIAPDETFTVPEDRQALYATDIDIDTGGVLAVDGLLIEVD